ncbi:MAG: DoxX family protein [Balneolaceae bacterium]|nr:DoxX family protein [Balneolaceae bacterium]
MTKESFEDRIVSTYFDRIDRRITNWMARTGITVLRIGLGIIFIWFGVLKFFPGLSPAEELVRNTVYFVSPDLFIPVLATWETLIGLGLISGKFMRLTLLLLFLQMTGILHWPTCVSADPDGDVGRLPAVRRLTISIDGERYDQTILY